MKKVIKALIMTTCIVGALAITTTAEAYRKCVWVDGYWRNGFYHEGHRVCWVNPNYHCRWIRVNGVTIRNCW